MKKLHTISFGCQMSTADSEEMARPLLARGYAPTPELEEADAVVVSTCTVRQHAEDKAVSLIGRLRLWKERRPERFLIVAGCAAERIGEWIEKRFAHVDLVVGATRIEMYPLLLEQAMKRRFDWARDNAGAWTGRAGAPLAPAHAPGVVPGTAASPLQSDAARSEAALERASSSAGPQVPSYPLGPTHAPGSAYVTIMRGCNYSCSYCIVPAVRGRELYRPFAKIIEETRARAAEGAQEVILLGQTVNSYREGDRDFADLLRAVGAVAGVKRLRFTSPHPFYLSDKMIAAMAQTPAVAPHLHLPAQSGSDRVLKAMRRNYTRRLFLERVGKLRAAVPHIQISTDLIVGFPGETEAEFRDTLSFVNEVDFCAAYCYKYSPRATTPAAEMGEQIDQEIKERRLAALLAVVNAQTKRHLKNFVGRRVNVLLESATDGRTEYHFKARLAAPERPGTIIDAEVTAAAGFSLKARRSSTQTSCGAAPAHANV